MTNNRSPFKRVLNRSNKKIEDKNDEATIYIYDEISWFGISADKFVKDFADIKAKTIHIRFNSPGGYVFDGIAMYNAIKQSNAHTIAHIDGLAASIASVIALGADEVRMSENAFLMIHDPWSIVIGNSAILREEADLLDKVGGTIAKTYASKSGKDEAEITDLMAAETWFSAQEALDFGLIDAIEDAKEEKAQASPTLFDLSVYANVPDKLKGERPTPTARETEKILRDAGFSRSQAKAILKGGYSEDLRDVDWGDIDAPDDPPRDVVDKQEEKKSDRTSDLLMRAAIVRNNASKAA